MHVKAYCFFSCTGPCADGAIRCYLKISHKWGWRCRLEQLCGTVFQHMKRRHIVRSCKTPTYEILYQNSYIALRFLASASAAELKRYPWSYFSLFYWQITEFHIESKCIISSLTVYCRQITRYHIYWHNMVMDMLLHPQRLLIYNYLSMINTNGGVA